MDNAVVLVVQDEALIRMSAVLMVEDAGFAAVEACNADEAIGILESRPDVRAVFTDINMTGSMDGWKLAHAIGVAGRRSTSLSHRACTFRQNGQLPARGRFIRKPYSAEQVTAALREVFGHAPDAGNDCGESSLAINRLPKTPPGRFQQEKSPAGTAFDLRASGYDQKGAAMAPHPKTHRDVGLNLALAVIALRRRHLLLLGGPDADRREQIVLQGISD